MTKRALLIGINYIGTANELGGCINDVKAVKKMLVNRFNYKPKHIISLTDETKRKPTKRIIMIFLARLVRKSFRGDTIYLHYSGHGGYVKNFDKKESEKYDQTIIPIDMRDITDDELHIKFLKRVRRGVRVYAVIDACHSGTAMDLPYNYRFPGSHIKSAFKGGKRDVDSSEDTSDDSSCDDSNSDDDNNDNSDNSDNININRGKRLIKYSRGRSQRRKRIRARAIMISGCRDAQTSADAYIGGRYQGALTANFIKVLDRNRKRGITLKNLMVGIHKQLEKNQYSQEPQLSSDHRLKLNRERFRL